MGYAGGWGFPTAVGFHAAGGGAELGVGSYGAKVVFADLADFVIVDFLLAIGHGVAPCCDSKALRVRSLV